jgi:DNA-binding SARP family transcriptional activator/tetratricopeptide (TPR) repeat protein
MPKLGLEFLGGFRVTLDGAPITTFESAKVRALLAYLATESQRSHPRESLATLIWPDWPDSAALSNLRYALSDLRKVIGDRTAEPPYLLISREAIQFNSESDHWLDVAEFSGLEGGQEIEQLERGAGLYLGEFMEGFSISDATPFEDWAQLKREQLHRAYREMLHHLAGILENRREYDRALPCARRQVEIEAWDESAQQQLMRLLAFSGRRAEALAQYETCRQVLEKELRVTPSAETARLVEQIREREYEAETPAIRITSTIRLPAFLEAPDEEKRPTFVAREQELQRLNQLLECALRRNGRVAFITGGAGRGKTALLREFARQAGRAHPDLLVAAGNCNPYSGVSDPYLPLRSVLCILLGNVELAGSTGMLDRRQVVSLVQAMPQALNALLSHGSYLVDTFIPGSELFFHAESSGAVQPELRRFVEQAANRPASMAQQHLFEQYCAVLRALSREYPLLILLDDLQWADSASAALLYHLGTRLEGSRILVLGAYRPEEIALGRDGERHPLEKALVEFKRLYGEAWLDLTASDEAKGRYFIDAFLDSEPNRLGGAFREQLFEQTEGHALFTIELLRAMQERGDLVRDQEGCWIETPVLNWESLPARVEAVIAERIERLEGALRETLSIASVEGENFTAQVTARVKEVNERKLLRELSQELEKRHRLVREQGEVQVAGHTLSHYRFAHALYQQYLYNHLGGAERRALHRATAEVLEELYAGSLAEIASQLAFHWQQAKDEDKSRVYMLLAGQVALAAFANQDAERYFRQALALDPDDRQRAVTLAGLGEALRTQAKREEAVQVLRQGIELYHQLADADGMARLYVGLSLVLTQDDYQDAWNACREGLREMEGAPDSAGLAYLLSEAGRTSFLLQKWAEAEDMCRWAIGMAELLGVPEAQAEATITLAMVIDFLYGKTNERIQMQEQVIPFCESHGLWYSAARAHMNLGALLSYIYMDIRTASQHTLQAAKISRQIGNVDMMFGCLGNLAGDYVSRGDMKIMESLLSDFLQDSAASKEKIQLFLEKEFNEHLSSRGEWIRASVYLRSMLEYYRIRHQLQGIEGCNYSFASNIIELYCLGGSGDLAEAEAALRENIELDGAYATYSQTALVKVYSLQERFAEAHALMAKLFTARVHLQLEARASHAMAERRWNKAASATLSLINLLQSIGRRWEWARALIDLGDIYTNRNQPGDRERAREAYQQSLEMFSEMEAGGYVDVIHKRLQESMNSEPG